LDGKKQNKRQPEHNYPHPMDGARARNLKSKETLKKKRSKQKRRIPDTQQGRNSCRVGCNLAWADGSQRHPEVVTKGRIISINKAKTHHLPKNKKAGGGREGGREHMGGKN